MTKKKPSPGNPFGNPPYPGITVAGGPNWVETLIHDIYPGQALSYNFAFSGATVDSNLVAPFAPGVKSFIDQVGDFNDNVANCPDEAPWDASNSVFTTWFGINDINQNKKHTLGSLDLYTEILDEYFKQVDALVAAGATRFVVLGVPPFDRSPMLAVEDKAEAAPVKRAIDEFNVALVQHVSSFTASRPQAHVRVLDTGPVFNEVLDDPQKYGAPNSTCFNADGKSCLWFNDLHPGFEIHKAVAEAVQGVLEEMRVFA